MPSFATLTQRLGVAFPLLATNKADDSASVPGGAIWGMTPAPTSKGAGGAPGETKR